MIMNMNDKLVEELNVAMEKRIEKIRRETVAKLSAKYEDLVKEVIDFFTSNIKELAEAEEHELKYYNDLEFKKEYYFPYAVVPSVEEVIKAYRATHPELKGVRLNDSRKQEIMDDMYGDKIKENEKQYKIRNEYASDIAALFEALGFDVYVSKGSPQYFGGRYYVGVRIKLKKQTGVKGITNWNDDYPHNNVIKSIY